jgi:hypothetical protein
MVRSENEPTADSGVLNAYSSCLSSTESDLADTSTSDLGSTDKLSRNVPLSDEVVEPPVNLPANFCGSWQSAVASSSFSGFSNSLSGVSIGSVKDTDDCCSLNPSHLSAGLVHLSVQPMSCGLCRGCHFEATLEARSAYDQLSGMRW